MLDIILIADVDLSIGMLRRNYYEEFILSTRTDADLFSLCALSICYIS